MLQHYLSTLTHGEAPKKSAVRTMLIFPLSVATKIINIGIWGKHTELPTFLNIKVQFLALLPKSFRASAHSPDIQDVT